MKKALMYAHVASMIQLFNMDNIRILIEQGYHVDVACNMEEGSSISPEKIAAMRAELEAMGCRVFHVPVPRKLTAFGALWHSLRQTKRLMNTEGYDLVHCHSPIGGVICRVANRLSRYYKKTKMLYTAHGFHFYKGAPRKNWLMYYPAERLCARWTDVLLTINREDYALAEQKFHVKRGGQVLYLPGVGVDTARFAKLSREHDELCDRLSIPHESRLLLSVGELNDNKNHALVVNALPALEANVHYVICGQGPNEALLRALARQNGCADRLHLLGYCAQVPQIVVSCDAFVFPSLREGLSVALMEAMAGALPVACGRIRGNVELIDEQGGTFFDPTNAESCAAALKMLFDADMQALGVHNAEKVQAFSKDTVNALMAQIYEQ